MLNTMVMSVFERTREIGILRAIGWRPRRVMRMILMESVLLSLGGGVIGTVGAVVLIRFLSRMPAVAGLSPGDDLADRAQRIRDRVVGGLIGAAYPAYRGARLVADGGHAS